MQKEKILLNGPAGQIEAVLAVPKLQGDSCVVICHPHPLHDGTMNNKVVTTLQKIFVKLNLPSIIFNFRGVGKSAGLHDNAVGEIDDCLCVCEYIRNKYPDMKLVLAGFSFGAYIASKVTKKITVASLYLIAPSVVNMDYGSLSSFSCPVMVVQGDNDEIVDSSAVVAWYGNISSQKNLVVIEDCSHFFHGKLIELGELIEEHYVHSS